MTFSHMELYLGQNHGSHEYTIPRAKRCKRWGPPCPFCAQSAPHPSPVESDWSEEDWDVEIQKRKREKQRKEEEMRQRQEEEKEILDSSYYPPEPMYVSNHEEQPPTLVKTWYQSQRTLKTTEQDKRDNKTEERQKSNYATFRWWKRHRLLLRLWFRIGMWIPILCVDKMPKAL